MKTIIDKIANDKNVSKEFRDVLVLDIQHTIKECSKLAREVKRQIDDATSSSDYEYLHEVISQIEYRLNALRYKIF